MKQNNFFRFLTMIGLFWAASIFGQTTVTYNFSDSGAVTGLGENFPGVAIDSDANVGFGSFKNSGTSNPAIYSGKLRLYQNSNKGGSIVIYANDGVTITSVVVNASEKTGPAGYTIDGGSENLLGGASAYTITDINATSQVEFYQKGGGSANRIYVESFEVTYISNVGPTAGITLGAVSGNTSETGSMVTFTAVLDKQPTSDVVLDVVSNDTGEITVNPAILTFTNANWDIPQTITATGVDDTDDDDNVDVTVTVDVNNASSDDDYDGLSQSITITNEDDELPVLVINEFLADPASGSSGDANGDGTRNGSEDEFIEIYNTTNTNIDISGYKIEDSADLRHTFPSGTVIPANQAIVVFGGGTPTGIPGLSQVASEGFLGLNNGGDTIIIKDALDNIVVSENYGNIGSDNQSVARNLDFSGSFVKHTTITSNPLNFSPGRNNTNNIPFTPSFEWIGTLSSDWSDDTNWVGGLAPTGLVDVLITPAPVNNPVISNNVTVINLTTNDNLTVENGSLIIKGISTGTVTYKRALTANWHLIASPVEGESITNFMADHTLVTGSGISPNQNIGLATYENSQTDPTMRWSYYVDGYTGGDVFDVAKGFTTKLASAGEITFTGGARIGDQTSAALAMSAPTGTDFNLLGNPFLAAINSKTLADDTDNDVIDNNTFWLWDGNMYQPYNDGSTIDIAPGQGFFVKAASTDAVSFKAMNQLPLGGNFQKENKTSIALMLTEGTNKRTSKILYIKGKTTGADYGYDSEIFSEGNFALYTQLLSNDEGKKLGIQTLPNDNYEEMIVPLGVKASASKEIVVSAYIQNLPSDINVYLEDRVNGTFTNLSEENFKVTLNEDANGVGQFYLHTTSKALSNETLIKSIENVSVYKSGKNALTIIGLQTDKAIVDVFSVVGKKVFSTPVSSIGVKNIDLPQLSSGVYIVNVSSKLGKISKKIILE